MLDKPRFEEPTKPENTPPVKRPSVLRGWFDKGKAMVANTWERVQQDALYAAETYPCAYALTPLILTGLSGAPALTYSMMGAEILSSEYKMECYLKPKDEQGNPVLCNVAKWFGAPTYEDYKVELQRSIERENKERIQEIQADCRDQLGKWRVDSYQIDRFTSVDCEDTDKDGTPDGVYYSGSGEDIGYDLKTGQRL